MHGLSFENLVCVCGHMWVEVKGSGRRPIYYSAKLNSAAPQHFGEPVQQMWQGVETLVGTAFQQHPDIQLV